MLYLDTSVLIALVVPEARTVRVQAWAADGGTGVATFVAWDVTLTEKVVVPEPASLCLLVLGAGLFWGTGRRRS